MCVCLSLFLGGQEEGVQNLHYLNAVSVWSLCLESLSRKLVYFFPLCVCSAGEA